MAKRKIRRLPPYSDEDTSKAAAVSMEGKAATERVEIYEWIKSRGLHGATEGEVRQQVLKDKHSNSSARVSELWKDRWLIGLNEQRPNPDSGVKARVMVADVVWIAAMDDRKPL
jgi:hypothetical protein